MAPILYYLKASPPVRSVLLTAKAIGIELELREVDLLKGEHFSQEFLKINPQHTIPTLDDDGFIICDSHAICTYLVSKYAKDDSLYPKDLKQRTLVDQRLHFDSGMLFPRLRAIVEPIVFKDAKSIPKDKMDAILAVFQFMESFLKDSWFVGDNVTLADLCLVSGVSSIQEWFGILNEDKYPKVSTWYKRCQTLPYYEEANGTVVKAFAEFIQNKMKC